MYPFQMRSNGLIVNGFRRKFELERISISNSIVCLISGIYFTLEIYGVISYLLVRMPIQEKLIYCAEIEFMSGDVT